MFKKSLLGIALSFAIFNAHANEVPQKIDTEIVKYEEIISKLKLQLVEKENFNKKLQTKLDEAMNLSKTIQPENVTQKQAVALNVLILKLNKNIQENKGDNQTLKNKIEVLDQFLNNYKKKIVDSNNNIIVQDSKHELAPNSEVKDQALKAEDLKKKEEIEKALADTTKLELKPMADVKPQELTEEDKAKKQKIEESIKLEKENTSPELKPEAEITKKNLTPEESLVIKQKEEKENPSLVKKEDPQLVPSPKVEEQINDPVQNIQVEEEKGFVDIIKDKINDLIAWFRNLFEPSHNEVNEQIETKSVTQTIKSSEKPVSVVAEQPKVANETVESIQEVNNEIDRTNKEVSQKANEPLEKDVVYKSFESEAVEHIAHNEEVKKEPVKAVDSEKEQKFNKDLEDFINKEQSTDNSNIENNKDQEALGKSIDQSIIIKVDKNKSDIKGTAFEAESLDVSKPLKEDYIYKVKLGDNLTKIVKKHFSLKNNQDINNKIQEIVDLNDLKNKNVIHIGDSIRLR